MKKFQVTIHFITDREFSKLIPAHRAYINSLISTNVIEHYAVSMESQRIWITMNAKDRSSIQDILDKSPLFHYFTFETDEILILDGQSYRLPTLQLN